MESEFEGWNAIFVTEDVPVEEDVQNVADRCVQRAYTPITGVLANHLGRLGEIHFNQSHRGLSFLKSRGNATHSTGNRRNNHR